MAAAGDELREITLHGHRVFFRSAGSGPALVLAHGITSTSATWANVLPYLAERFTVIAPDLIGHGESAKPRGDYSLGAYASGIRDLLLALGHERATFVGHSLGGGVAMQLAYQFPEHCERLVLVASGGLGREINALLRAASLPGSELVLPFLVDDRVVGAGRLIGSLLGRIGLRVHTDVGEVLRGHASLSDGEARAAFLHTLRPIVDLRGQRVDATDRLYLAQSIPVPDHLGRARSDHPGRAWARRPPARRQQPAGGLPRRRPLPAPRRPAALRARAGRLHRQHRAVAGRRRPLGPAAAQRGERARSDAGEGAPPPCRRAVSDRRRAGTRRPSR